MWPISYMNLIPHTIGCSDLQYDSLDLGQQVAQVLIEETKAAKRRQAYLEEDKLEIFFSMFLPLDFNPFFLAPRVSWSRKKSFKS